ncbi:MAG: 3-hydroxyacyl-ACP dehydratase FabZ [Alphaproteobacteria bacterium]|nr:3-hydroxyacyl-ACP dehydratase FabZ [Alphaproteobacteria bacterium]
MTAETLAATEHRVEDIDIEEVMRLLPHRYPFLMVDKVVDVVLDERARGVKNVSINEFYFQGHFPEHPVMPGVLVIEAMAQTAAVLVMRTLGETAIGKIVYFMAIDDARFRKPVVPGDQLHVDVVKQRRRGSVWRFAGEARVNGSLVAEATITAMIHDGASPRGDE